MELSLKISGKINLYLDILGQLADGYHAIDTVMQSVDLYDTLHISSAGQTRIFCPGVPQEKNSAYRAVQLFFAESGLTGGAEVHIRKGIPLASGMGGSSADAAGVLLALNRMFGSPFSRHALLALGARIGADVCFLMEGGSMRCRGIGEQLEPVVNHWHPYYLAVRADGCVTAAQAYGQYDLMGGQHCRIEQTLEALAQSNTQAFFAHTANALEWGCTALCPDIGRVLSALRSDPHCLGAFMTGSGSICLGVYDQEAYAQQAQQLFPGQFTALLRNTPSSVLWESR